MIQEPIVPVLSSQHPETHMRGCLFAGAKIGIDMLPAWWHSDPAHFSSASPYPHFIPISFLGTTDWCFSDNHKLWTQNTNDTITHVVSQSRYRNSRSPMGVVMGHLAGPLTGDSGLLTDSGFTVPLCTGVTIYDSLHLHWWMRCFFVKLIFIEI